MKLGQELPEDPTFLSLQHPSISSLQFCAEAFLRFFQTIREGTCFFFEVWWLVVNILYFCWSPLHKLPTDLSKAKKLGVSRGVVVLVGLLDCVDWFAQLCLDSKEVDLWCRGMDGMVGGNGPWLMILRLAFCWMKMVIGCHFCATFWEKPSMFGTTRTT